MRRPINILLSLIALNLEDAISSMSSVNTSICRSNDTHIVWKTPSPSSEFHENPEQQVRKKRRIESVPVDTDLTKTSTSYHCSVQTRKDAEKTCMDFLRNNIMPFDEPFTETMGFPLEDDSIDTDGLGNGLVEATISLALDAKVLYKWTDDLPPDIFFEYVLNYANLNEARTNWRPLLVNALKFNETDLYQRSLTTTTTTTDAVAGETVQEITLNVTSVTTWVNTNLWTRLGREGKPIYFKSSQTPLIFDPMSIIAFGYASCTGTSILFCNALRAVGVPARVAGTPAWYGNRTQGNHNWVEVYVPNDQNDFGGGEWRFLEPSPALPNVDTLDSNPCDRWFCDPSRYRASKVYAARLSKPKASGVCFPLAWEWDCNDVPAVDRTEYYARICGSCGDDNRQE
mmetsp:Transcript_17163/g.37546  ORF Transcript_17163/g.37546 Transcript_17163/m.37546 type:complete len:400 (+) Transcript_17163:85-1284(+)